MNNLIKHSILLALFSLNIFSLENYHKNENQFYDLNGSNLSSFKQFFIYLLFHIVLLFNNRRKRLNNINV